MGFGIAYSVTIGNARAFISGISKNLTRASFYCLWTTLKTINMNKKDYIDFEPSVAEADHYWKQWLTKDSYVYAEDALCRLFKAQNKEYLDASDLMIKCSTLNDFYSTRIFAVYNVVKHYLKVKDLKDRLAKGDLTLVEDLRKVKVTKKDKTTTDKDFYSFATKFCAHHNPEAFPIYDSYVDRMLRELRNRDGKICFCNADLKDYKKFVDIILQMKKKYGIEELSFRRVDIMLWLAGKEYFK